MDENVCSDAWWDAESYQVDTVCLNGSNLSKGHPKVERNCFILYSTNLFVQPAADAAKYVDSLNFGVIQLAASHVLLKTNHFYTSSLVFLKFWLV